MIIEILLNCKFYIRSGSILSMMMIFLCGNTKASLLDKSIFDNKSLSTYSPTVIQQQMLEKSSEKLSFEENLGQIQGEDKNKVRFVIKGDELDVFILESGIAYQYKKINYPERKSGEIRLRESEQKQSEDLSEKIITETFRMDALLIGANHKAEIIKDGKSSDYINYYNHDALNVHSYQKITYKEIYPRIDWVLFFKDDQLEYEFVVHPGGNPDDIKIRYEHAESVNLLADGSIRLKSRMGDITDKAPISFQGDKIIRTNYHLENNLMQFRIADYDRSESLVIDPVVEWATYYGSNNEEHGRSCVVDKAGNVYLGGRTNSGINIASGGYQNAFGGNYDAFLIKFNNAGLRMWATYYGGSGNDVGFSCAVDGANNIYLAGWTSSVSGIAFSGHQNIHSGNQDAFLVKFNSSGGRIWATYYGGDQEEEGFSCAIDGSDNVYLAGHTGSNNIALGGHQNTLNGYEDAFLVKFNSAGIRQWATYYGGSSMEVGYNCSADHFGNIYLAGTTVSGNNIAFNGHQNIRGGNQDAFLAKFNSNGVLQWATYYGGSDYDDGFSCALDFFGNVFLAGGAYSSENIAFNGHQNTYKGNRDAFLVKFNNNGVLQWATYYGGNDRDESRSCSVDDSGNVYLAGHTSSIAGIASGGYQNVLGGNQDAFLAKFNSNGVRQWATYYGGKNEEEGRICTVDNLGSYYLTGYTSSNSNIASDGYQNIYGGGTFDAFLVKFSECPRSYVTVNIEICKGKSHILPDGRTVSMEGSYPVTLKNAAGCDSIVTTELTVNEVYDVQLTSTTCNPADAGVFVQNLATSSGCDSIVTTTVTLFPAYDIQLNSTTCIPADAGVFVQNLVTSSGCDSIVTTTITLLETYQAAVKDTICAGEEYILGNQTIRESGTYSHRFLSQNGCDSTVNLQLTVSELPYWEPVSELMICKDSIVISIPETAGTEILWNDGSAENDYIIGKAGSYSVTLSNNCGEHTAAFSVVKSCDDCSFVLPQAFSPDNNRKNDTFKPISTCEVGHFYIRIYNRWGHLLFESGNLSIGWDGRYNGSEQMMDSYIWHVEYQFKDQLETKQISGSVLLLR